MKARVTVTLKTGILDPQGKAIEGALRSLQVPGIDSVRQGKVFDIEIADGTDAEQAAEEACETPTSPTRWSRTTASSCCSGDKAALTNL